MALTKEIRGKMDDLDLVMDSEEVNCACCKYNYHNGGDCDPSMGAIHAGPNGPIYQPCVERNIEDCIDPELVEEQYEQLRDEIKQYKEDHKEDSTDGYYD